jgi:transcription initiation factor TFIIIB Brf1 subunit/transcription initiation factor TFIIB
MPNTGIQCPNCRVLNVNREWVYGNSYLICNACGYRWH